MTRVGSLYTNVASGTTAHASGVDPLECRAAFESFNVLVENLLQRWCFGSEFVLRVWFTANENRGDRGGSR